ncbi:glycosyltransferase [Ensifer sp. ENS05]|uniref:glycosyltransferase family 2 protein n=1 Tax=Ensifer sp. ENS05 TaxID=2769277 RepID=UPI0017803F99|nr:glycosyltransferase family 2 protein [Ensifer sp. ENS05]MBD9595457.1 glycosyltransferase [Ensifer sp. ENS05]
MAKHRCAIVIPTKNAMATLPKVLAKALAQQVPWSYEIIVIDSGSSDGTKEYLRGQSRIRLVEIEPQEFGHGRTRNLGIAAADADLVAFLTHDAEPVDSTWLRNLVAALEQNPDIAGAFGRHIAYETASPFTKRDLELHFQNIQRHPLIVYRDLEAQRYETDEGWRQLLHFYSDNNSIMRKSVWNDFPYPDVDFAEDQLWAQNIIQAGYKKAYAPDAVVFHSHDYSYSEQLRRAYDESRNFRKYFGYRLSPSPVEALARIVRFSFEAFRQEIDERFGIVTIGDRLRRAGQRAALVAGHCLGANHEKLPKSLSARLSLDRRLFRS